MSRIPCFFLFFFYTFCIQAQSDNLLIVENGSSLDVLDALENTYSVKLFYSPAWFEIDSVSVNSKTIDEALSQVLHKLPYEWVYLDAESIVLVKKNGQTKSPTFLLTGRVVSSDNQRPVPNVTISAVGHSTGTVTDVNGDYSLELPEGVLEISAASIEFEPEYVRVNLTSDYVLNIELYESAIELQEIVISARNSELSLEETQTGKEVVLLESIRKMPSFLGEVDVSRIIQRLPGVQTVGEGASGFNVRGGRIDQNLILLDGIPIYNSAHLLGFFSVFNSAMVNDFSLYKGNMPARFSGRLSSVVSVKYRNPDLQKFKVEGGIGPLNSKLMVSVPLKKRTTALTIGGRVGYPNWIIKRIKNAQVKNSAASFQDVSVKLVHRFGEKDFVSFTSLLGNDEFQVSADSSYSYSSKGGALEWNHIFTDQFEMLFNPYVSSYSAELEDFSKFGESKYTNGVRSIGGTLQFNYRTQNSLKMNFGGTWKTSKYQTGLLTPLLESSQVREVDLGVERASEITFFGEGEVQLNNHINFVAGLTFSNFLRHGESSLLIVNPDLEQNELAITDTLNLEKGDIKNLYKNLEPRLSMNYRINSSSSIKGSFTRTVQYENLFSNSTASLPTDIWLPSSFIIKPQVVNQYSIGVFKNIANGKFEVSAEMYYKDFESLNILQTGTQVVANELLPINVFNGVGRSTGLELIFRKNSGVVTGWFTYTLSRTQSKLNNAENGAVLNEGEYFSADFDQPHNLNVSSNFQISRLWSFSANFVYSSGRPVTIPESSYVVDGNRLFTVVERNNFRIPPTHRLDLSVTLEGSNKRKSKVNSSFTFSLYNVYSRKNPFSVFTKSIDGIQPRAFQLAVIGSIVPSFTYNFKF